VRVLFCALAALFFADSNALRAADPAESEIVKWRASRDRDVLGPDGPFTLVARFKPKQGLCSIGRAGSNDLVLPVQAAPQYVGRVEWPGGDRATFRVEPGITALADGKPVSELAISKPAAIKVGDMTLHLRFRDAVLRVSVQDANAAMRKNAKAPVWFPIDLHCRIEANWTTFPEPKMVRIPDSDGGSRVWKSPGYASFSLDGQRITLQAVLTPDGKQLSFLFRDATAGHETYGAGRFLEADLPKNGKVLVDFNEAYNPFCAYNALYVCPIPPAENHMTVRVTAGERKYPHPGEGY
jgi:uncharacterized protein (DUF1684 family)